MRTIKRIIKIHSINDFVISCLFNNGESRIIDFKELFGKWKVKQSDTEYLLMTDQIEFHKIELIDGTFTWKNIEIEGQDDQGTKVTYYYELDPIMMYENSRIDETRQVQIGLLIKQTRNEMGLTQEELAEKSGTTKHSISRIENNRTGIELSTLKKIIEGGLGRRLKISII